MKFVIFAVIIAIIGGIVFYAHTDSQKKARMEAMAMQEQVEYAEKQHSTITKSLEGISELGGEAWAVMTQASNMIPTIVGDDNAIRVYDKDFVVKKRKAAFKAVVAKTTVRTAEDVKQDETKTGVVKDEFGREAPAGYAARAMAKKREELKAVAKTRSFTTNPDAASAHNAQQKNEERIKACQKHLETIYEHCYNVDGNIAEADTMIEQSTKIVDLVKVATTATRARDQQLSFKDLVTNAKGMKAAIKAEIGEAKKVVPQLTEMKRRVAEEKQAASDAAAKRMLAAERDAKRKREMSMAGNWYQGKAELLKTYQFAAAAEAVKGLHDSLTYEEAQVVLKTPAERYRLVAGALKWLKEQFNETPMSWGWKTASGLLDIEKADDEGIYVQGKLIAWTDIPKGKLVGFFNHYLKASDDVGRGKADLYIGVALFCKTFGLKQDAAKLLDLAGIESDHAAKVIPALMDFTPDSTLTGK